MKPIRIQRSRQHKQTPPNELPIKYVGRGTKWGNPFRVVKISKDNWQVKCFDDKRMISILTSNCHHSYKTKNEAAKDAVKCYAMWFLPYQHGMELDVLFLGVYFQDLIAELKGQNLSCWCKVGEHCHADWLLKQAN